MSSLKRPVTATSLFDLIIVLEMPNNLVFLLTICLSEPLDLTNQILRLISTLLDTWICTIKSEAVTLRLYLME